MRELWSTNQRNVNHALVERVKLHRVEDMLAQRVRSELKRQGRSVSEQKLMTAVWDSIDGAQASLRVAVRTPRPFAGPYRTATEDPAESGSFARTCQPGEDHYAQSVIEDRQEHEMSWGLWVNDRAPVSGIAVLHAPPGLPDSVIRWYGEDGDNSMLFGPHLNILNRDVLDRTLFLLGDSFNLMATGDFGEMRLGHRDAAFLTATQGTHPHLHPQNEWGNEVEYIEGLILGGICACDVQESYLIGGHGASARQRHWHLNGGCYLTWRALELLN